MKKRKAKGKKTGALDRKIEVLPENIGYWQAFCELSTERQMSSAGLGPIPWLSIKIYADTYNYDLDEFIYIIRAIDSKYLELSKPKT